MKQQCQRYTFMFSELDMNLYNALSTVVELG
jgi:hypothetical protein